MIPDWKDQTAVAIASGASLTKDDVDYCKGKSAKVCVINDNYRLAPWADLLYACDREWWDYHKPEFSGQKWTCNEEASRIHGLNLVNGMKGKELNTNYPYINYGGNSGFQLLNLLLHTGVNRILMLGYDFQFTNGQHHWFGSHPFPLHNMHSWSSRVRMMDALSGQFKKYGVKVINCTRETAITGFDRDVITNCL